jgi:hypothetical protein
MDLFMKREEINEDDVTEVTELEAMADRTAAQYELWTDQLEEYRKSLAEMSHEMRVAAEKRIAEIELALRDEKGKANQSAKHRPAWDTTREKIGRMFDDLKRAPGRREDK